MDYYLNLAPTIYYGLKRLAFNPDCAVDTYCGFKSLAVPPRRDFTILILDIFINMPAVQNRSNFAFR